MIPSRRLRRYRRPLSFRLCFFLLGLLLVSQSLIQAADTQSRQPVSTQASSTVTQRTRKRDLIKGLFQSFFSWNSESIEQTNQEAISILTESDPGSKASTETPHSGQGLGPLPEFNEEDLIQSDDTANLLEDEDVFVSFEPRFKTATESDPEMIDLLALASACVYNNSFLSYDCQQFERLGWSVEPVSEVNEFLVEADIKAMILRRPGQTVVAVPGTQNQRKDWGTNLSLSVSSQHQQTSALSTKSFGAHSGFANRTNEIYANILKSLLSSPGLMDGELWVTGHSLGSAVSTLLAMNLYLDLGFKEQAGGGISNRHNQVKLATFGSVYSLTDSTDFFLGQQNHLRFDCPKDPVIQALPKMRYEYTGTYIPVSEELMLRTYANSIRFKPGTAISVLKKDSAWKGDVDKAESYYSTAVNRVLYHSMIGYAILAKETFIKAQENYRKTKVDTKATLDAVAKTVGRRLDLPACSKDDSSDCVFCRINEHGVLCQKILSTESSSLDLIQYTMHPGNYQSDRNPIWSTCMVSLIGAGVPGVVINAGKPGNQLFSRELDLPLEVDPNSPVHKNLAEKDPSTFGRLFTLPNMAIQGRCIPLIKAPGEAVMSSEVKQVAKIKVRDFLQPAHFSQGAMEESIKDDILNHQVSKVENCLASGRFIDCRQARNAPWCPSQCVASHPEFLLMEAGQLGHNPEIKQLAEVCSAVTDCATDPLEVVPGDKFHLSLIEVNAPLKDLKGDIAAANIQINNNYIGGYYKSVKNYVLSLIRSAAIPPQV